MMTEATKSINRNKRRFLLQPMFPTIVEVAIYPMQGHSKQSLF